MSSLATQWLNAYPECTMASTAKSNSNQGVEPEQISGQRMYIYTRMLYSAEKNESKTISGNRKTDGAGRMQYVK